MWAEDARAVVWRRIPATGVLVREDERFRPWLLLDRLDDLLHLGSSLGREGDASARVTYRELEGDGRLRYLVSAENTSSLTTPLLQGASHRLGRHVRHVRDLEDESALMLPVR